MNKFSILALILILLNVSCARKESITPLGEAKSPSDRRTESPQLYTVSKGSAASTSETTTQKRRNRYSDNIYYIRGRYYIDKTEVNNPVKLPPIAKNMATMLINTVFKIGGNFELDTDPIPLDISEIDLTMIKEFYIRGMEFYALDKEAIDQDGDDIYAPAGALDELEEGSEDLSFLDNMRRLSLFGKKDLKFIKKMDMYIHTDDKKDSKALKLLSYDRKKNEIDKKQSKECEWKCIKMRITNDINLIEYIISHKSDNTKFVMARPIIKLGKVPTRNFVISGFVDFEIGIKIY